MISATHAPLMRPYEAVDGELRLQFHKHQWQAWDSTKRFVLVLAGTQSGKTSFGPAWLWREIQRRGPGDYLVVTPTFPLLEKKALPEFKRLFESILKLGKYVAGAVKTFTFSKAGEIRTFGEEQETLTQVFFGHAQDPDSLESATAKAAWLDECGQKKFKLDSWQAILRRLSIHMGRVLMTTTPYNLGWLKQKIWDAWRAGDEDIDVIRFRSIDNPAFPREEYERAKRDMQRWKFDMFYNALFTRPAGMIYDCFDEDVHRIPRFAIPDTWRRYLGLDFGGVNTAGVFLAEEPGTRRLYAYREYWAGGRTAKQHAEKLLAGEPMRPLTAGGSKSEGQWRNEFRAAGLPMYEPPISDVEVGINRVYGAINRGELYVFDDLEHLLDEIGTYARVLDDMSEPTEAIENKNDYHLLDGLRYIISKIRAEAPERPDPPRSHSMRTF
ncbi:MAG: terminase [Chloroflexota bacterium]